jgi:hypothetical protein
MFEVEILVLIKMVMYAPSHLPLPPHIHNMKKNEKEQESV